MSNRTTNQASEDANSRTLPSWKYQVINSHATTSVAGLTVFHGYNLVVAGTNWTGFAFDNATTGYAQPAISILTTTTPGFIAAGDIICTNGLTFTSTQGTAGIVVILYL